MKGDGEMARMPELQRFARRHGLKILTTNEIIKYRLKNERLVQRVAETHLADDDGGDGDRRLPGEVRERGRGGGGEGQHRSGGAGPGARPRPVLHGGRAALDALRLRRAEGPGAETDRRAGGRLPLPAARGAGHRPAQQAARLSPAGRRPRHGRCEPGAGVPGGRAGLRDRDADPAGPGGAEAAIAHQQPGQAGGPGGVRTGDRGARAAGSAAQPSSTSTTWRRSGGAWATCSTISTTGRRKRE